MSQQLRSRSLRRTFATPFYFRPDGDGADDGAGKPEGADDGRPDWLPENFADGAALAKSYDESRREMDRMRSQMDDQQKQFAAALEQLEAQQPAPPPTEGLDPVIAQSMAAYDNAIQQGDNAAALAIQIGLNQHLTRQTIDTALEERFKTLDPKLEAQGQADRDIAFEIASERVAKSYGDQWGELQPDVQKWLREHPNWLPSENKPEAFEQVIREAARTVENERLAEQARSAASDRAAKLAAATGDGSGQGRHPIATDAKKAEWEAVKNSDVGSYSGLRGN